MTNNISFLSLLERTPPIQQIIDAGIVPRLVHFLTLSQSPKLQFEASWILTNIASGTSEQTKFVVDAGAVPYFIHLMASPDAELAEQAVWALGNIAGDSVELRDYVTDKGAISALLQLGESENGKKRLATLRNVAWTISNLCRAKPSPPLSRTKLFLPLLTDIVQQGRDPEATTDACWALSYISDGAEENIQAVLDSGVVPRLVELLSSNSALIPPLRTLGNIATGNEAQTQVVVNLHAIPVFCELLSNNKTQIRKETCWTLSNITAGTESQIQAVIDAGIMPKLIAILNSNSEDRAVRKEAAWAIANTCRSCTDQHIRYLVNEKAVYPLTKLLFESDDKVILVALEALEGILKCAKNNDYLKEVANMVRKRDGVTQLKQLQSHNNSNISRRSLNLTEEYFLEDDNNSGNGDDKEEDNEDDDDDEEEDDDDEEEEEDDDDNGVVEDEEEDDDDQQG